MHATPSKVHKAGGKAELYRDLARDIDGLLTGETNAVANLANAAAAIYQGLPSLNWAGFYLLHDTCLVLGPFQGQPACVRIPIGQGVCGTAAARRCTVLVPDVHAFPGHIACDANSRSELVVPLIDNDRLLGVLDLDSPLPSRFDADDQAGCEALAGTYCPPSDVRPIGKRCGPVDRLRRRRHMLIDHRTYTVKPGTMAKQMAIYQEFGFGPQKRHLGEPLAYLITESGEVNTYVHIWVYQDAADRAAKRAAMGADPEWQTYLQKTGEAGYLIAQRNNLMTPAPFAPVMR